MKIIKADFKNKTIKYRAALLLSFLWNKKTSNVIKKIIFWPAITVFGMPLLLFAEKKNK
jgi:hypothetical protein